MMLDKSISTETVQGIFTEHIPGMLGVHEILLKNLKQIRDKGVTKPGIHKVFEKLVCFLPRLSLRLRTERKKHGLLTLSPFHQANAFQNYGYYFVNHAGALKLLTRKKENRSFGNFIKTCEANPQCKNLSLQSYLIKPIQRLTKYPLLLKVTTPLFLFRQYIYILYSFIL